MLLQELYSGFIVAFVVGLAYLSNYFVYRLHAPVLTEDDAISQPDAFIASRAWTDLKYLNDIGPKVTGSDRNEILAVNYLLKCANQIKKDSFNPDTVLVDHQIVSGVGFVSSIYRNIQNVVVRIQGTTDYAVMLNCHFDSRPGSPGANDDLANCCIMMEILRVLSKSKVQQRHSIIFLFNGSEEEDLQGSHGFVTQHRWAKDVKAFINVEGSGSGGREILFHTGPKHDWLVHKYRQSAQYPFGYTFAEELFETGVIPSGTDFQIFHDDGNIPGLDFAHSAEGWHYHTNFDDIKYLNKDFLQQTGVNIIELTKTIANCDELENPPEGSYPVFFDYIGLFFISYTRTTGIIINIVISLLAIIIPFLFQTKFKFTNYQIVIIETLSSFATIIVSSILSMAACFIMAVIMNALDKTMTYYNVTFLAIGIYCSLAIGVQIGVHHVITCLWRRFYHKKERRNNRSDRDTLQNHLNGINLFWAIITLAITATGYRSGYFTMVILFISLCTNILMYLSCHFLPETTSHSWIILHLFGQMFNFLWTGYFFWNIFDLAIPNMGKSYYSNPDVLVGLICAMGTIMTLSYFIPLTYLVKYRAVLYSILATTFIVSFILAMTSVGFPYSGNPDKPRVQRHKIIHTKRTYFDEHGDVKYSDAGYLISQIEKNSKRTISSIIDAKNLINKADEEMCEIEGFCGFSVFPKSNGHVQLNAYVTDQSIDEWMISEEPPILNEAKLVLVSSTVTDLKRIMNFELYGNSLTILNVIPVTNNTLLNWTLTPRLPEENVKQGFSVKITNGKFTDDPLIFSLTFDAPLLADLIVKIVVSTLDSTFDRQQMVEEFVNILKKFPDYTFVSTHQAVVSSFIF